MIKIPHEKHAAYHEAGHSVAYIVMELDFGGATIIPEYDQEGNGITAGHTIPLTPPAKFGMNEHGIVDYAGPVAEAKYRHCTVFQCFCEKSANDLAHATEMRDKLIAFETLQCAAGGEPPESKRDIDLRFEHNAKLIINRHWNWVHAIAQALLEKKTLTYDEIIDII
ncbi:MAG: hypothetical protein NTV10_00235 [Methanoregula sp.]|nr:hypothetical protein [Methanoregula sp.]